MNNKLMVVPAPMLRMLQGDGPVDNVEMIRLYLIGEEGAVKLTDMQMQLKERYEFADNLMRTRLYSNQEVEQQIQDKFNIGVATARKDIANAQYLFGSTNSRNKNYLLSQHYDSLQEIFRTLTDAKDYKNAGVFAKLIGEAIKMMPEDHRENNKAAAIIFNISVNNYAELAGKELNEQEVMAAAKRYAEDLDFENLPGHE